MMQGRFAYEYNEWERKSRSPPTLRFRTKEGYERYMKRHGCTYNEGCYPCVYKAYHHNERGLCDSRHAKPCNEMIADAIILMNQYGGVPI